MSDEDLTGRLLQRWPATYYDDKRTFVFLQRRSVAHFHAKLYLLLGAELAKRGYPCYYLFADPVLAQHIPALVVDGRVLGYSISEASERRTYESSVFRTPSYEWDTDFKNERACVDGVNLYPEILCTLRALQQRYNLDLDAAETQAMLRDLIASCDTMMAYFNCLHEVALRDRKQVIVCGWETNYVPSSVFAKLCALKEPGGCVRYLDLNRGYMHYFNKNARLSSYVAFADLTRRNVSSRMIVSREQLEEMPLGRSSLRRARRFMRAALKKKTHCQRWEERKEVLGLTKDCRRRGNRVYVLFAHLFYDTGVMETSRSFADMTDWILATIDYFRATNDLLLLKPHPAEIRLDSPRKNPTETLASLTEGKIDARNMRVLHPFTFGICDLAPHTSVGLIWRSSVAIELTYLGVPCVIAGNAPYRDLDLHYSSSRQDYFRLVGCPEKPVVTKEQVNQVMRYIQCLRDKHYEVRQIDRNSWRPAGVKKALDGRDRELKRLVDAIVQECR